MNALFDGLFFSKKHAISFASKTYQFFYFGNCIFNFQHNSLKLKHFLVGKRHFWKECIFITYIFWLPWLTYGQIIRRKFFLSISKLINIFDFTSKCHQFAIYQSVLIQKTSFDCYFAKNDGRNKFKLRDKVS